MHTYTVSIIAKKTTIDVMLVYTRQYIKYYNTVY